MRKIASNDSDTKHDEIANLTESDFGYVEEDRAINAVGPQEKYANDDPDYNDPVVLRNEESAGAWHRLKMWLINKRVLLVIVVFLFILFFVILPLSEMEFYYSSALYWASQWARAFRSSAATVGTTVFTIIVTSILAKVIEPWAKNKKDDN